MKTILKLVLSTTLLSVSAWACAQPVILINTFSVAGEKEAETLAYWEEARDILEQQPGYVSTKLHRSLSTDATYRFVNVAVWQTSKQFKEAIANMQAVLPKLALEGVSADPNLYEVIRD
ncbi:antibiotic biosynthesis monooxygenase [Vibrio sp. T187]|uniref:antibiotic biosynthesis monooxygenase family protein n=1 Tax=Vibrio TaxID=662 RepID=UPI0010C9862C|nr:MULTISPECIES: antibiotic biosynthesis monooxygenase family protein [Vibrio]MBW3694857.1 antibiotic biosynthesis monooxygenase [Vibrio sp. T187]